MFDGQLVYVECRPERRSLQDASPHNVSCGIVEADTQVVKVEKVTQALGQIMEQLRQVALRCDGLRPKAVPDSSRAPDRRRKGFASRLAAP